MKYKKWVAIIVGVMMLIMCPITALADIGLQSGLLSAKSPTGGAVEMPEVSFDDDRPSDNPEKEKEKPKDTNKPGHSTSSGGSHSASGGNGQGTLLVSEGVSNVFTGTGSNPVSTGRWYQDINANWYYSTSEMFRNTWGYIVNTSANNKPFWYYFDSTGKMLTGWQKISNKWYYLVPSAGPLFGTCLLGPGKTPDGYEIDANGAWTGK